MSWLYTVIFAGLVLSSNGDPTSRPGHSAFDALPAATARQADETENFERSYPLNANGRVNISNVNGSITVEAWDRSEVKLQYTKVSDSKERLAEVEVRIDSRADYFSVETKYDNWKRNDGARWKSGKLSVEFRLMVPRTAMLNEIETVNGSITVSDFTNFTNVSAVNGTVKATNIRGTAKLSTVNGEVAADLDRLESGSKIDLSTVNGKVNLIIPSDANATVKADSLNGSITNDFGLPVRKGKYVGRDLYGRIGSGDVQIKLSSVNGALSVGRRNDGRNPNPAIDLLPQKGQSDDWDNDSAFAQASAAKMNRDIARAVKETEKVSAKAAAEAQKEWLKIQPEIAKITADSLDVSLDAIETSVDLVKIQENTQKMVENAQRLQKNAVARIADISFPGGMPTVEKKSNSFPIKGVPKVTVKAPGCSVKVSGWDKSEVQYRVIQFQGSRDRRPLNIREEKSESAVTIIVDDAGDRSRPGFFGLGPGRMRWIEVMVPNKSDLKIDADGELRVEGVTGNVELSGSDQPINVRDMDGKLRVTNSDGLIRVIGFRGEINAATSDGMISLEGDFQKVNAVADDGAISLTLPENTSADLEASCDSLKGEGIQLTQLSTTPQKTKYRIGNGGPLFQIETNGDIAVRGAGMLR